MVGVGTHHRDGRGALVDMLGWAMEARPWSLCLGLGPFLFKTVVHYSLTATN